MARKKPTTKKGRQAKVHKVMKEWQAGTLRAGSKEGPKVTSQKQAVAIALSEAGQSKKKAKTKPSRKKGRR